MSRRFRIAAAAVASVAVLALPAAATAATTASAGKTLTITAPVTAAISVNQLSDGTSAVTNFAFPETAPGATSAASTPYRVELTSTSAKWQTSAAVTTTFTDATSGATLPNSAILVKGVAQGATYANLGSSQVLETPIARATLNSSYFTFEFAPAAGADSGDYSGVVTVTASTL
jgi:hypothetical protein